MSVKVPYHSERDRPDERFFTSLLNSKSGSFKAVGMHIATEADLRVGLPAVLHHALCEVEAKVVTPTYRVRLTLASAFLLTAGMRENGHFQRCCDAILGRTELRSVAYGLFAEWAAQSEEEQAQSFAELRASLARLDPAFSSMTTAPGRSLRAFSRTVVEVGAFGTRPSDGTAWATISDAHELEIKRSLHARKREHPLSPQDLRELFRVADGLAVSLGRAGVAISGENQERTCFHLAVLIHTGHWEKLHQIFATLYPRDAERSDLLESFVLLSERYQDPQNSAAREEIALLLHSVLLRRDSGFASVPMTKVQQMLATCPNRRRGGRGRTGAATALAELISLAPPGTLGFKRMDAPSIARTLGRASSSERRTRKTS